MYLGYILPDKIVACEKCNLTMVVINLVFVNDCCFGGFLFFSFSHCHIIPVADAWCVQTKVKHHPLPVISKAYLAFTDFYLTVIRV